MRETPGPIPNPEVKPHSVDGTARVTVWESRTSPGIFLERGCSNAAPFSVLRHIKKEALKKKIAMGVKIMERSNPPSSKKFSDRSRPSSDRSHRKLDPEERRRFRNFVEPVIPADVLGTELAKKNFYQLKSLAAENAETVAKQLVMIERLLISREKSDWQLAHQFGLSVVYRAGRVGIVREYAGLAALKAEKFEESKRDLRAAHRISGKPGLLVYIASAELGLKKARKALEILGEVDAKALGFDDLIKARIVSALARLELGQLPAAQVSLNSSDEEKLRKKSDDENPNLQILLQEWDEVKARIASEMDNS